MQTVIPNKIDVNLTENNEIEISIGADFINQNVENYLKILSGLLKPGVSKVYFAAEKLLSWDSSLLLFIYDTKRLCQKENVTCDTNGLPKNLRDLINLAFSADRKPTRPNADDLSVLEEVGKNTINILQKTSGVFNFISSVCKGIGRSLTFRSIMRKVDFLSALQDCGPKAVGIVCLISFLVGLILAFVGAVQLQTFGAQIYVASLVTIGMCRIMGAIMVGIIMAGRTGSSYAATIGTMQVNEELDALQTMGLSKIDFLVLPRLYALLIAMPILTMIADFLGMMGGAFIGVFMMNLPYQEYWKYAFNSFHLNNFLVGVFHGLCFGIIIALCGCFSGLNCGRNADSVGKATTQSVVCAIVWMIVVTGIITVICQELKI